MRKAQRWKKPVPLYDRRGKFLEYISHENGRAMVASGGAEEIRQFKYGREFVTSYRETQESKSPVRSSFDSLFPN